MTEHKEWMNAKDINTAKLERENDHYVLLTGTDSLIAVEGTLTELNSMADRIKGLVADEREMCGLDGGAVTATADAWGFIYEYLEDLVKREIGVVINGEMEIQLHHVDGESIHDNEALLIGTEYDKGAGEWAGATVTMPLFDNGVPTVQWVHIL